VLAALRSPDYRRFWAGSFVSNLGTWIQAVALGWLVYALTGSASWLGAVSFAGNLPMFFLAPFGGALADRASRRAIMASTQSVLAAGALALAVLVTTGRLAMGPILVVVVVAGCANALYAPAAQTVIPSLVEPPLLLEAISLNSVQFNLARTLGPALAGVAYAAIGPAGCFALNGLSFLALIAVLLRIRIPDGPAAAPPPVLHALREGFSYARRHRVIGPCLFLATVMALFGFPYIILLPALARGALGLDASGLAWLTAAVGCGAVAGGLVLPAAARDVEHKGLLGTLGAVAFGGVLGSFAVVRDVRATAVVLAVLGFVQTICMSSLNTVVQLAVDDAMRGRVMSIMTVILFGLSTGGSLVVGAAADAVGVPHALAGGGAVIVLAALGVLTRASALVRPVEE
jgi:MFS family permease